MTPWPKYVLPLITAAALAAFVPQDPPSAPQTPERARPAAPPADAKPLPPVQEPFVVPVPRLDLPMRFQPRDPLEGFWQLTTRGGPASAPARGMIAIGRTHMMVQMEAPGTKPSAPLLRAGCYSWQRGPESEMVRMTVLTSFFNDADGAQHAEPTGAVQIRRFQVFGERLRVYQNGTDWVEFVRVE